MSALAHYIEAEGVPTVTVSLVREHSEYIRPPRTLWVPFELGRPFGVPNDREFQANVLRAALKLLDAPEGPVLEDYPLDAPAVDGDAEPWTCLLPAPPEPEATTGTEALRQRLASEIRLLRPWYDEAVSTSGRTAVGISGLGVDDLDAMAAALAAVACDEEPAAPERAAHEFPMLLRFIADDLKAYYFEAAAAQPRARRPTATELGRWLFGETAFGDVLYQLRDRLGESEDQSWQLVGRFFVPRVHSKRPAPLA
ncbi:MAG: hypothetical protein U5Q44_07555 [Dehalococcoidia bacterium]|nr:hypothetical protein [Dehalococcoidia bacterium]